MAITYTYDTGKMSDFSCKRIDTCCHRDPNRTVLIGVFCKWCKFYEGIRDNYVLCSFHKKDDEGSKGIRSEIYEELRDEALSALSY